MSLGAVVVGTGFGCVTHVRALRAAGFEIVALVGRDPRRTADRARLFEVERACTDLGEALALRGADVVTIATPPHSHAAFVLEAIAAERHVLCEKPFARDAAEARVMLDAAERAGIVHLVGTEFRWDPGQATLARTVASGAIGEPRVITVLLHVPVLAAANAEVPDWWADPRCGGGWFGAHGSQVIDQVRVTAGEVSAVSASFPHLNEHAFDAEDSFVVHLRMASGATAVLASSAGDWGPMMIETRVAGTQGSAWIDGVGSRVSVADRAGSRVVDVGADLPTAPDRPEPVPSGALVTTYDHMIAHGLDLAPYTRLAEIFGDLVLGRPLPEGPAPATFRDGVAGMAVLDAARASAAVGGRWVGVELQPGGAS